MDVDNAMSLRTAIQKNAIVAVVAIGGGFFGSVIRGWIQVDHDVLRANRFEVIDKSGIVMSFRGPENNPETLGATRI
jgi:hypothetical protein